MVPAAERVLVFMRTYIHCASNSHKCMVNDTTCSGNRRAVSRNRNRPNRALRNAIYGSATMHPLVAAIAFEIWEEERQDRRRHDNKDLVAITGSKVDVNPPMVQVCRRSHG